jgi:type II secretory pathway pseudopilin PulG
MLSAMGRTRTGTRTGRAFTMVEVLVAVAITLIFVGSIAAAFMMTIRASDEAEAVVRANNRARIALEEISSNLRLLSREVIFSAPFTTQTLILTNATLAYGDGFDDDNDGAIDEEVVDGFNEDGDAFVDQHLTVDGFTERARFVGVPDLGDRGVDDDVRFGADEITFVIPSRNAPDLIRRRIRYYIGTFQGQDYVLLRETTLFDGTPGGVTTTDPIAFDVVGLDILAWDPNTVGDPPNATPPYWVTSWDALAQVPPRKPYGAPDGVPAFDFPASFYIRVTASAEPAELSDISDWPFGGRRLKVRWLSTVVTVESVQNDFRYEAYVRE